MRKTPKRENVVYMRLTKERKEQLERIADKRELALSTTINDILKEWLRENADKELGNI